jgi:hypothetical protein
MSTITGWESRAMSNSAVQGFMRNALVALIVGLVAIFLIILFPRLGKKVIENLNAENFARAVLAQNPKVFKRIAEVQHTSKTPGEFYDQDSQTFHSSNNRSLDRATHRHRSWEDKLSIGSFRSLKYHKRSFL